MSASAKARSNVKVGESAGNGNGLAESGSSLVLSAPAGNALAGNALAGHALVAPPPLPDFESAAGDGARSDEEHLRTNVRPHIRNVNGRMTRVPPDFNRPGSYRPQCDCTQCTQVPSIWEYSKRTKTVAEFMIDLGLASDYSGDDVDDLENGCQNSGCDSDGCIGCIGGYGQPRIPYYCG